MAKSKKPTKPSKPSKSTKPAARRAAGPAPKAAPTGKLDGEALAGELRQLAAIRRLFPGVDPTTAAALMAHHDEEACREKGTATRASDTFRVGMAWARTFGEHTDDPAVENAVVRVRWFLDCLTALGNLLDGKAAAGNPVDEATFQDISAGAERLLERATRRARNAVGTNKAKSGALDRAREHDGVGDPMVVRLRQLAKLLDDWRGSSSASAPPLSAYGVTADTVHRLRDAAQALEDAVARRPAPRQVDRDTPAINAAEGRLYFVMRPLWDDLAEAREDGKTSLQLTVSPTLLRGLDMHVRKPAAPATPTPTT